MNSSKQRKFLSQKRLMIFLSIGLSFISVHAGFGFYEILFGMVTAIMASAVFETLRLTSLYGILNGRSARRFISAVLYMISVSVCAFASVASFHSKVIIEYEK